MAMLTLATGHDTVEFPIEKNAGRAVRIGTDFRYVPTYPAVRTLHVYSVDPRGCRWAGTKIPRYVPWQELRTLATGP